MSKNRLGRPARPTVLVALALAGAALIVVASGSARISAGPGNLTEPTISGPALVGERLTANPGLWAGAGPFTFAYQWLQCKASPIDDSSSTTCKRITGATGTGYTVANADLDMRIRVRVRASNNQGTTTTTSPPTSVVSTRGDRPASVFPPVISGSALVGQTLRTTTGTWTGDQPITYSFKWLRCNKDGHACAATGRTQSTYTVAQADVGRTLRTRVIARNARGQGDAYSGATDVVQAADDGLITLPDGTRSVDVKNVPRGERLIVDSVRFSPNPTTSRQTLVASIRVRDSRGYVVRNAIVFIRSTPRVTTGGDNSPTSIDGWVTYTLQPIAGFPTTSGNLQFFVKAYRKGDPELGGISASRLVQVGTRRP